jgi:hypothetical protein
MNDLKEKPQRPEPDAATLAEIAELNGDQRAVLESVLADKPALSHKDALEQLKAAGF